MKQLSKKHKKLLLLALLSSLLLIATTIGISVGVSSSHRQRDHRLSPETHAVVKTSCSSTLYPDLCYSAIATAPSTTSTTKISTLKDVIAASLNLTTLAVEHNYFTVKKLIKTRKNLTVREKIALHDCLESIDETLDELRRTLQDLLSYQHTDNNNNNNNNTTRSKSLKGYADDMKTLISSAITDQETCLDGFSHGDADRHVRDTLQSGQVHVEKMSVTADGFLARDLTIQNTAGPAKHQAVALRVGGDLAAFYQCDILAYQDTLYVHKSRQFYVKCLITGTVDFIFGNAAVVFQDCDIHARKPNPGQKNMVTAQSRTDPNQNTGIVIQKCRIGATSDLQASKNTFPTYLGRPWQDYSRTIIMQSTISDVVHPAGWHEWEGDFALKTLHYGEYKNTGPGADTSKRVQWRGVKVITDTVEAQQYTPGNFIAGGNWLPATAFPFSLGL
ncbi:hypothetical protein SOVF_001620 [Spinacia oleracea]|nr:hypothetical protein SOVF_001620 [Spinacia oleracea]